MSLKELNFKAAYNSDEDDILNDFYIPALENSKVYKRIAGFFTSTSLAIAARGMAKFIENNGKIQLIANVYLSEEDYNFVKNEETKDKIIEQIENDFLKDLEKLEDNLTKKHVEMLGWLLKTNRMELKIAVVNKGAGIQHQKIGIMEDEDGNKVSFNGSDNETESGWTKNIENFHVYCSWISGDDRHLIPDLDNFEKLWEDKGKKTTVLPISKAVKEGWIRKAPRNEKELEKLVEEVEKECENISDAIKIDIKKLKLRSYQEEAMKNWFNNNSTGLLSMATGTGKTETAIGIINEIIKKNEKIFIIITVPGRDLVTQWINRLSSYGIKRVDGASSDQKFKNWKTKLKEKIRNINLGDTDYEIIVTTNNALYSLDFVESISKIKSKTLLVADEVHNLGAEKARSGLRDYDYRLGISATPSRWYDEDGTKIILDYFKKNVYNFSMKRAMSETNPDDPLNRTYLCQYEYYPKIVFLNSNENLEFIKLTDKIRKIMYIEDSYKNQKLKNALFNKRADIKKNAEEKFSEFEKILNELDGKLDHCIVYCSSIQMLKIKNILKTRGVHYHEFTQNQSGKERRNLLEKFEAGLKMGGYDVLLAIDCLTEGIDIPSAKIGIFMDNSQNPNEFIQRRGRVLRQPKYNKDLKKQNKISLIYDFIAIPTLDDRMLETERKEIQKEFNRVIEFSRLSLNPTEAYRVMNDYINKYALIINNESDII